jgi:hypothetical protein
MLSLTRLLIMLVALALMSSTSTARAQDDEQPDDPQTEESASDQPDTNDAARVLVDTPNVHVAVKNVRQEDESGDSQFGIGVDWTYSFERQVPTADVPDAFETCDPGWMSSVAYNLSLSGKGFTSLGDPQTSQDEVKDASNFNSITNRLRYAAFLRIIEPCERFAPGPFPVRGTKKEKDEWKQGARKHLLKQVERDAEGYTAVDFGLHAESESNQTFADNQGAFGASAIVASGLVANYLLYPLKFLVPNTNEYGDVVQSPQLFLGIEGVVGASHRKDIDGADDEDFTRFRLELGWTTEVLIPGLYPFIHYHYYRELDAERAIKVAGKDETNFYEFGVNYYVGNRLDAFRTLLAKTGAVETAVRNAKGLTGILHEGKGPFVTARYAAGALPPYLESDHQASVGLGITF